MTVEARRRAVGVHDLHHVLTGYGTDWTGEFQISAWELASGCGPYGAGWLFALTGTLSGLLFAPQKTLAAFRRGRRSSNLYRHPHPERLAGLSLTRVRRDLGLQGTPGARKAAH